MAPPSAEMVWLARSSRWLPPPPPAAARTLTVLHSFPYSSGDSQNFSPNGTVLIGPGGTLYATTQGPSLRLGLAIALAPPSASRGDWTEYQIYAFPGSPNAGGPFAGVVSESASLFGTTFTGGDEGCGADFGCGTVYQLAPGPTHGSAWTGSLLHTFIGSDGNAPEAALTVGPGGRDNVVQRLRAVLHILQRQAGAELSLN